MMGTPEAALRRNLWFTKKVLTGFEVVGPLSWAQELTSVPIGKPFS